MENETTLRAVIESLGYDAQTGVITWRVKKNGIRKDRVAGSVFKCKRTNTEYLRIRLNNRAYMAHRLAWAISTGSWPPHVIDHINGNGLDNRKENLRQASVACNARNARLSYRNKSGSLGVYHIRNKWRACIRVNYRLINLGLFTNRHDAVEARKQAEREYGFHPNHGSAVGEVER